MEKSRISHCAVWIYVDCVKEDIVTNYSTGFIIIMHRKALQN